MEQWHSVFLIKYGVTSFLKWQVGDEIFKTNLWGEFYTGHAKGGGGGEGSQTHFSVI